MSWFLISRYAVPMLDMLRTSSGCRGVGVDLFVQEIALPAGAACVVGLHVEAAPEIPIGQKKTA